MYWLDPDGGSQSNAFLAYCDMTSYNGGWTMCYTTDEYVKPRTEVTYSAQFPYGSDGYRTDCNNIPVSGRSTFISFICSTESIRNFFRIIESKIKTDIFRQWEDGYRLNKRRNELDKVTYCCCFSSQKLCSLIIKLQQKSISRDKPTSP